MGSKVKSPSAVGERSKVNSRGSSKVISPSSVGGKKNIKSVTDFFGSAPVKRSPYFKSSSSGSKKKDEVHMNVSSG